MFFPCHWCSLKELAGLNRLAASRVALQARKILINLHLPSYERRRNNMENEFLEALEGDVGGYIPERLQRLVDTPTAVFDVISEFFFHKNKAIQQAALEVYVRRAYIAYTLNSVKVSETTSGANVISWEFQIAADPVMDPEGIHRAETISNHVAGGPGSPLRRRDSSHHSSHTSLNSLYSAEEGISPLTPVKSVFSVSDLQAFENQQAVMTAQQVSHSRRMGVMAVFSSLQALKAEFEQVLERLAPEPNDEDFPINVINVAVPLNPATVDLSNDEAVLALLSEAMIDFRDQLHSSQVNRITFIVPQTKLYPKYFTFRARLLWGEDAIYRHVDPGLAFKLELFRLG